MKRIVCSLFVVAFVLTAATVFAQDIPDLRGTWACEATIVASVERGIYENPKANGVLVIEEQQGRVFAGHKKWAAGGKLFSEKIVGGIAMDGELYIAEEKDGQILGDLAKSGDMFVVFYVESGPQAKIVELKYRKTK